MLDLRGDLLGVDDRIGVDRDGVDAALDEELAELRIDARELAADGHGLAVLVGDLDEMADGTLDGEVTAVGDVLDDLVVAVEALSLIHI